MQTFYENSTERNKDFDEGFIMWDWFWRKTMFCLFSADSIKSDDETEKSREPRWILGECNHLSSQLLTTVMTHKLHSVTDRFVWKQRWRPKMKNNNPSDANLQHHHNIKKNPKNLKQNRELLFLSCDVWQNKCWSRKIMFIILECDGTLSQQVVFCSFCTEKVDLMRNTNLNTTTSMGNVYLIYVLALTCRGWSLWTIPQPAPRGLHPDVWSTFIHNCDIWCHTVLDTPKEKKQKTFPGWKITLFGRTTNQ